MNGINIIDSNVNLFINSTQVKKVRSQNYNIDKLKKNNVDDEKINLAKNKTKVKVFLNSEEEKIEETQSEIFVNSQGEQIVAIKTLSGSIQYIKIGEITDFLLNDNKTSANINLLEKAYNIQV